MIFIAPTFYAFYFLTSTVLYLQASSFFITGLITSIFDGMYGLACLYCGKILTKVDGRIYFIISTIYMTLGIVAIFFIPSLIAKIIIFLSISLVQPFINLYKQQNFLDKGRILGLGNQVTMDQVTSTQIAQTILYSIGLLGFVPILIASSVTALIGIYAVSKTDKKVTATLVDYLSQNPEVEKPSN